MKQDRNKMKENKEYAEAENKKPPAAAGAAAGKTAAWKKKRI